MDLPEEKKSAPEDSKREPCAEFQDANALLHTAMNCIPAGIAIVDAPKGRLRYVNDTGLEIGGVTRDEVAGIEIEHYMDIWKFFDMDGHEVGLEDFPLVRAIMTGETLNRELVCRSIKGEERIVLFNAAPVRNECGEIKAGIVIFTDLTEHKRSEAERKRLEEQLQQAQKMESIGRLAGGVAHDFNNMLSVIIGQSELGLMRLDPGNRVRANLAEILETAKRSAELTRQLLAFARKQTVIPELLDINEKISGTLKIIERLIGENIELCWRPGEGVWRIRMDTSQLDQVLSNLCLNARDAIDGNGSIVIETANRMIDEHFAAAFPEARPGEYVCLSVTDSGVGMDSETQSLIFEPFFTTKKRGKGIGLGLAMVYGAVRQNNGFIDVSSEPGRGTRFSVYLRRHEGEMKKTVPAALDETSPPRGGETILIVEDEPAILNFTSDILRQLGYTVIEADTPGKALALAGEYAGKIDMLITDVIMPEMNGRELSEGMISIFPGIKCIFMSGYTDDVIADHGVLLEGAHFISKPFSLASLAKKLREVLDIRGI